MCLTFATSQNSLSNGLNYVALVDPMLFLFFFLLFWGWSGSASVFQYHADHCTSKDSNKIWVNKHVKLYQLPVHLEIACEIQVKFV